MKELIKITENNGKKAVSARELYDFLELDKSQWSRWARKNIVDNEFAILNIDWSNLDIKSNGDNQIVNPKKTIDFVLTMDFAKKLSMMSRTEKGEQARQYFIDCEKQLSEKQAILSEAQMLLMSIQQMQNNTVAIAEIKAEIKEIKQLQQNTQIELKQDYYSILAYCNLIKKQITFSEAIKKGKIASQITKENNQELRKISDERFGYVNSYPIDVLEKVFKL